MIGVFDSGSGGLTVLRAIRDRIPSSDIVYFGDIKNAPYGSRPAEELSMLTIQALTFLQAQGARSIVSACNSVSASLALSLFDMFSLEPRSLIEMVGPTAGYFRGSDARLALCATPATIRSGVYQNAFRMVGKEVTYIAIPDLAGTIEFGTDVGQMEEMVRTAFRDVPAGSFDVLVLACTHYPLIADVFKKVFGEKIFVFDPALAVGERVEELFWPREAGYGKMRFCISKDSEHFRGFVSRLFPGEKYTIEVIE
ncbi:MAG: aspartate/glutamate racemase family protein [Candidatus Paceibacterota bacterium]